MNTGSEDQVYRGYKLSGIQSGPDWYVTIWPIEVGQVLPDPCEPPPQGVDKEQVFAEARGRVDELKV